MPVSCARSQVSTTLLARNRFSSSIALPPAQSPLLKQSSLAGATPGQGPLRPRSMLSCQTAAHRTARLALGDTATIGWEWGAATAIAFVARAASAGGEASMIDRRNLLLAAASAAVAVPAFALGEPSRTARSAALHR